MKFSEERRACAVARYLYPVGGVRIGPKQTLNLNCEIDTALLAPYSSDPPNSNHHGICIPPLSECLEKKSISNVVESASTVYCQNRPIDAMRGWRQLKTVKVDS